MSDITKVIDRVRKLLSLADHSGSEHEAALAASRATALMAEYQLTEAFIRLDDADAKPEPILDNERLEPDAPLTHRKRVAWKEAISGAVARDLGVREYWRHFRANGRRVSDIRGFGRESAIQTWRYTCEYLWRQIEELADAAWRAEGDDESSMGTVRSWKNAFKLGCASRISERIYENRKAADEHALMMRRAAIAQQDERQQLALALIDKDQTEVDTEYQRYAKDWKGSTPSIGAVSSGDGYSAGKRAGDRVALGAKRAGLAAGQGRLK